MLLLFFRCWQTPKRKMDTIFEPRDEFEEDIKTYCNEALRTTPFDETNEDFLRAKNSNNIVDLACFLVEHGYDALYLNIQSCALEAFFPRPTIISRLEQARLAWVAAQSTRTFEDEHVKRNRAESWDLRLGEIDTKFPKKHATRKQVKGGVKCCICLYEIKHKQHVRTVTCCEQLFHRKCVDTHFQFAINCPLCRTVLLNK